MTKWNLLLCVCMTVLVSLSACRDKELLDEYEDWIGNPTENTSTPSFCFNNEYDFYEGESDIDCGDDCEPCSFTTPCLNVSKNEFVLDGYSHPYDRDTTILNNSNIITYTYAEADGGNTTFTILLDSTALRTSERKLETGHYSDRAEAYLIKLTYTSFFGGYIYANDGFDAYLVERNNEQFITFCDVTFFSQSGNPFTASGSFKLIEL